ncbi:ABC transporter permease [Mycetocola spongiae]|uniref:ABC transporter permease n=1 Tax=Mycetocola spongiae TaxID=2859226 RepID=UPI001CF58A23|nr:ABC transporter permease [Mycetocola spongiae]UCR88351.1 ABC transporter permease [Mycetocola spongiae]
MSTPTTTPTAGTGQVIWLVAEREMSARLRSRAFLISTGVLMLIVLGSVLFSGFAAKGAFASEDEAVRVATTAEVSAQLDLDPAAFNITVVADAEEARDRVRSEEADAAVLAGTEGLTVIGESEVPGSLVSALTLTPTVELLQPDSMDQMLRYFVSIAFGIIFMFSAVTFGTAMAQSVVEEKSTRVVEILISTVSVRALLAGKVLGNSLLAFAQVALIAAIAVIGLTVTGQDALLQGIGAPILWFVIFFVFGFVLLASMFAAFASLVSRQEDVGTAVMPVTTLIMIPYIAVIAFNNNETVMTVMSYVPFSAAVGMPVRMFSGEAQWWEPVLSLAILLISTVLVIGLAARIYRASLLHTGGTMKLTDALRG